jgi:hypothetical protein
MKCNEFTREQLRMFADRQLGWSSVMGDLWHKIWLHYQSCPSCYAVIQQAYRDQNKETAQAKEQYPHLSEIAETRPPFNWQEVWFHEKRRRKLSTRTISQ